MDTALWVVVVITAVFLFVRSSDCIEDSHD